MSDLINREDAVNAIYHHFPSMSKQDAEMVLYEVQGVEPLADIEQRIFLAAIGREEAVCRKVDEEIDGDVNLVRVCKAIERKVKKALWS